MRRMMMVQTESEAPEGNQQTRKVHGPLLSWKPFVPRLRPSNYGPTGKEWVSVDFIVDSGASDSRQPKGFKEFAIADGRIVPNLGSKVCRSAFQNGVVATGNFTVVDTSKRLISVGKMISMGHSVSMTPKGGHILLMDVKTQITIYHWNGVWKIPTWTWNPEGSKDKPLSFRGRRCRKSSWSAVCRRRWRSANKTFEGARQTYSRDECCA